MSNYKVNEKLQAKFEARGVKLHNGTISEERLVKDYIDNAKKLGIVKTEEWAKEQIEQAVESGLFVKETQPNVNPTQNNHSNNKVQ